MKIEVDSYKNYEKKLRVTLVFNGRASETLTEDEAGDLLIALGVALGLDPGPSPLPPVGAGFPEEGT